MIDPVCTCDVDPETTLHNSLLRDLHSAYRLELVHEIYALNPSLKHYSKDNFLNVFLYGTETFTSRMNREILKCKMGFLKTSDCFSGSAFC